MNDYMVFALIWIGIVLGRAHKGIPLELREHRRRARIKRWEKLDEEERENSR